MKYLGLISFLTSLGSLISSFLGIFLTFLPIAGTVFSFGAVFLAILSIIIGGVALAKKGEGDSEALPVIGIVVGGLGLVFSLLVAFTCGMCNVCSSASMGGAIPSWQNINPPTFPSAPFPPNPSPSNTNSLDSALPKAPLDDGGLPPPLMPPPPIGHSGSEP